MILRVNLLINEYKLIKLINDQSLVSDFTVKVLVIMFTFTSGIRKFENAKKIMNI